MILLDGCYLNPKKKKKATQYRHSPVSMQADQAGTRTNVEREVLKKSESMRKLYTLRCLMLVLCSKNCL